eukprot:SAG22_NODE_7798_length_708_cov_0.594417_1_plen_105_part_00
MDVLHKTLNPKVEPVPVRCVPILHCSNAVPHLNLDPNQPSREEHFIKYPGVFLARDVCIPELCSINIANTGTNTITESLVLMPEIAALPKIHGILCYHACTQNW